MIRYSVIIGWILLSLDCGFRLVIGRMRLIVLSGITVPRSFDRGNVIPLAEGTNVRKRIGGMRGKPRRIVYGESGIGSGEMFFTDCCVSYIPGEMDYLGDLLSIMVD